MHFIVVLRIVGFLLMLFSTTLAVPAIVSAFARDGALPPFLIAFLVTLITGLICWLPVHNQKQTLRFRDGFLVVVLFWTVLAAFGSLPFVLLEAPSISMTEAFFESMSGLTTTGATTLVGIDDLPLSVRYYRQQLQWLGGMGIIVLAVAVMPMLGIGGMQLYRAETPGPVKDSKLTPRIAETAKALWLIYLSLTVLCTLGYLFAGMSLFDAICHAFSTVAIGGFSTHDASLGYFTNPAVPIIAMFFMVVAAMNFALHFAAFRRKRVRPGNDLQAMEYRGFAGRSRQLKRQLKQRWGNRELVAARIKDGHYLRAFREWIPRAADMYRRDSEARVLVISITIASALVVTVLTTSKLYPSFGESLLHGTFQVISIATTTGFTTDSFSTWPAFLPALLIMLSVVGGCAGSTAGGMKIIRVILLYKQGKREISKLVHPNALIPIKLNGKPINDNVINAVWGFFSLYVFSYVVLALATTATGVDLLTAFSAVTACLNNLGPGLGNVADNYQDIPPAAKWILSFAMLLGRLEMFTLLVLFTRTYWRS